MSRPKTPRWQNVTATRIVVISFSFLCGAAGITAGCFEILQGNTPTNGLIVSTVGPEYRTWDTYAFSDLMETYSAFTVVPNFLASGILAITVSCAGIIWAASSIHRKNGVVVYFLLCIAQFLVGGSFVLDLSLITCVVATRIGKPLSWWRSHLHAAVQRLLVKVWPWSMLTYAVLSIMLLAVPVGANSPELIDQLGIVAALMFVPLGLMIVGGFAVDIRRQ